MCVKIELSEKEMGNKVGGKSVRGRWWKKITRLSGPLQCVEMDLFDQVSRLII